MAQLAVEDLSFSYPEAGRLALDQVNLSIEQGEYVCICGRSGCGKTTLLRQFKTVLAPAGDVNGRVLFDGEALQSTSLHEQSARIGFVMQNPDAQIVTDKVWHELAFGLENLGVSQRAMRLRVAEMASYFGIQQWLHRDVCDLSGGQKQLLNLASIMAMQPSILILDEPTSQLDPIAASDFLNTVRKINIELGTTVIITEHRLEDVYANADKVMVMEQGRIIACGMPRDVSARLFEHGDAMACALPTPVRVFYGVAQHAKGESPSTSCPLTVREGRTWLAQRVREKPPTRTALLEDEAPKPAEGPALLEMKGVWFRYDRDAPDILRGVDLRVFPGQLLAIVGGNGTGKSTMLKCACGALRPYRGRVRLLGKRIEEWERASLFRGGVAMLPQDPANLFAKNTVRADLEEMIEQNRAGADACPARVDEVARICDIVHLLDMHPFDLSGGEQQRAALAKVLLCEPRLLLLDEPTKGIDSFFKRELARIFDQLKERGIAIVMVSHDIEFCARFADAVSMFFDGGIEMTSSSREFFAQNSFYTTAANRMSRSVFSNAVTDEDVIELCLS